MNNDFELKSASLLKTNKDLAIKEVFSITDSETSVLKGQRFGRVGVRGATYSMASNEYLIGVTALAVAITVGLPDARLVGVGKEFRVKDEVGGALTTNITISSENERTIDGATSLAINTAYGSASLYSDGSNWFTF